MKRNVHIVATGGYSPGDPITNAQMEQLVGPLTEELMAGISIQQRFWVVDPKTGENRETNSELAYKAVKQALDRAGLEPGDVDLLIVATGTPDYPLPPTVGLLQDLMGLQRCAVLEIRSGGAGGVQALDIARFYLEAGAYTTAVVVGSEVISPALAPIFLGKVPDQIRMRDRLPVYMFGDGAGAMVLQASDKEGGLRPAAMAGIGGGRKPGIIATGGGTAVPMQKQAASPRFPELRVDVVGAGDFTPYMVTEALADVVRRSDVSISSVDHCLIPEGNVGWMLDSLRESGLSTTEWAALEGKVFDNLAMTGAVGCAAVPLFLDEAWKTARVRPGDRVMLVGIEATKWIYAGIIVDWTAGFRR
jgi:3-oxoacyl-[acyl-carrier-protein] synthase III